MMVAQAQTLVLGASAAGLATSAQLRRRGRPFELLEAEDAVASAWRRHYDRLHLHTPKAFSALPGLRMPRGWPRYVARQQVVEYLEQYREHFDLHPRFGQRVTRLERVDEGWVATTDDGIWRSTNVVVATGRTRVPVRPTWPGMEDYEGEVLHSSEYRNGDPWIGKPVLVVGFGNSACEQALDLVERGAVAHLSVRSPVNVLPRDIFRFVPVLPLGIAMRHLPSKVADALARPMVRASVGDITKTGLRKLPYGPNTQIARDHHIPLLDIGTMRAIRDGRITVHGGVERFSEHGVVFQDDTELAVDAVILARYRAAVDDFLVAWEAVCDEEGTPFVSGGPTALPGLYFCGMYVSPAGMLREIGIEATHIADAIAEEADGSR